LSTVDGCARRALEYGIEEADWLDLSSGLAPWPFPVPEIPLRAWARLPETDDGLEQAACDYYGTLQCIAGGRFANGHPVAAAFAAAGKVGVLSPCYAEHAEAWRRNGYIVREVLEQEVDFFVDSLDVLVVVNPNNPTGLSLTPARLLDWHARLAQRGGWLVVDEAFMDNTPH
jgi:cobalamin biosynthetic protein CobC